MLLLVTGCTGSGKSAYARHLAQSLGREAIRLACPTWPPLNADSIPDMDCRHDSDSGLTSGRGGTPAANPDRAARRRFDWTHIEADADCALALNRINMDSNPYRAERRALVLDSLSGWLRQRVVAASMDIERDDQVPYKHLEEQGGHDGRQAASPKAAAEELLRALLEFEGIVIVVTEEAVAGLASDPWERLYIRLLAEANRRLADASHAIYRMSFGIATAIRGERL